MLKRLRWMFALLAVLALVATACGNSDDDEEAADDIEETEDEGGDEGGGGATDVGVTDKEILVSQIVSTTGVNVSGQAGFEKGFEAYIEALNAGGGVHGRKIKLVSTRNDNSEPARQSAELQQAVEQDKVFLVAGSWPSFGGAEYAVQNGVPVVGTAYDIGWHRGDNLFGVTGGSWKAPDPTKLPTAPAGLTGGPDAYIASKLGVTKIGTFGYTHSQSKAGAESVCAAVKPLGFECTYTDTTLNFGFTDLGASVERIKSSGAKHFYAAMDLSGCTTILRSFKRAGLNDVTLRCAVGYGSDATEKFLDVVDNMFIVTATAPFESDNPEMKRFVKELTARKPGTDPSTTTLNGWLAGVFIEDVLDEVGPNLTRKKFIETVRTSETFANWNAKNLLGGINWTKNQHESYLDPNFKPDPDICSGYLVRVDIKARKWVQVGQKPQLCLRGITSPETLKKALAEDKTKITL